VRSSDVLRTPSVHPCVEGGAAPSVGRAYRVGMAEPGPLRTHHLDEQLCFALYTASRAMIGFYRPMLESLGLTYPQYLVMLVLWERGEATVTSIGAALQLETGTLSPLLKRLESTGFVERRRQESDERSVLVSLTPAGRELRGRVPAVQQRASEATGLTGPEIADLRETLHTLTAQLRSARPGQPLSAATDTPMPPGRSAP
jgi:MarR family transcriptional regulator, organic hydroperoxide resistance regulator